MAGTGQWALTCIGCGSPGDSYCNTCKQSFCPECKVKHQNAEITKHHVIVPYSKHTKAPTRQCEDHPGNVFAVWCETCSCAVCTTCITSSTHRGHALESFQVKTTQKRAILQADYESTKNLCSLWQDRLSDLDILEENLVESFEGVESEIRTQADKLCHEIRQIEVKRVQKLQDDKKGCLHKVHRQRRTLQCNIARFEKDKNDYEDILRTDDAVSLLEFDQTLMQQANTLPPAFQWPTHAAFTAGELDVRQLEAMFGQFESKEKKSHGIWKSMKEKDSKRTPNSLLSRPRSNSLPCSLAKSYVIYTGCKTASPIICLGSGLVWIATSKSTLQRVDKDGNVTGKMKFNFTFCDATLTPTGHIMLLDDHENCVRVWSKEGDLSILFFLESKPFGICQLSNDEIIITFRQDRKVIKYTVSGQRLIEFDTTSLNRPWNVAQNKENKHIYLTDKTGYGHFKDSGRIMAFNTNGDFIFEYSGPIDDDFAPVAVCTNEVGSIFITDYVNQRVHILDKDGRFLKFLKMEGKGLENPCRIDIDSNFVWISEHGSKKVKVVRFT